MKAIEVNAAALLVVGGLNRGLVGLSAVYQVSIKAIRTRWNVRPQMRPATA